ncbi:exocyst complex component 3-like protein 4 [Eublepharis macularius]|uniref:Exocyst complex component 3-like protein 4 n=1 Tax=Eublepharis macularius TaxID=481883 RepID=A0AA97IZ52_EUBMA|nr:exocyst complex component 3-like protein 4 [Eublepharis macularius]
MDDSKGGTQEADIQMESPSESWSPEKCPESEDSYCADQLCSPPLNNEREKETKSPNKAFSRILSFSGEFSKSFKKISRKDSGILRSSKWFPKRSFKQIEDRGHASKEDSSVSKESGEFGDNSIKSEPVSEHKKSPSGSLEKCTESEDSDGVAQLNSPPLNNEGEKKTSSPNKSLAPRLTSTEEIATKEPGILRNSKRFASRGFKWIEDRVRAQKENRSTSEQSGGLEGHCIKKELLPVMEINKLIQTRELLKAIENIRDLETELMAERNGKKYEDNPKEYSVRAKDVDLLYDHISKAIQQMVQETLDLPSVDEKALTSLVTLIEEEKKAHPEASKATGSFGPVSLSSARNWRGLWKEAVNQSANERVCKVQMPLKEGNPSWLSLHLGFLRTAIKEDLLKVKLQVHKCYPQDYNVCDTYTGAFHKAVSLHLSGILEDYSLTFNEAYALFHWIANEYHSEKCLGHPDLKPEIKTEDLPNLLSPEALDKLENDYLNSVKEKTKICLDNILKLQTKRKWDSEVQPEALQSQQYSLLALDIQTMIGQHVKASGCISNSLETATLEVSLKEVMEFVPRFEKAFLEWDKENNHPQFVERMVTYVNDFHDLLTGLEKNFSVSCQELEKSLNDMVRSYQKHFLHKLRLQTQPMFKNILSQQWILRGGTFDSFIMKVLSVTEEFSKPLTHLQEPIHKDFLNEIHKYVVKEYIVQILKSGGKRRRRKREEISKLMKQEATIIDNTMKDLGSSSDWLFPAIPHIADIIGEKKKRKVKDYLKDLTQDYPDIRREHILSLLALRGWWWNQRQSMADQIDGLSDGLETGSNRTLFAEIELPNTVQCF